MQIFDSPIKSKKIILALGAESAGNFSIHIPSPLLKGGAGGGLIYFSENFGDLLEEKNWLAFQKAVLNFLKKDKVNCKTRESALGQKIKPDIIISDLHPLMKTTLWGQELSKKYKAKFIQVQHHHAHTFSAIGDSLLPLPLFKGEAGRGLSQIKNYRLLATSYGLAMDGTGYGTDEHIWGGEVFQLRTVNRELKTRRIGHLENQIMIGGDLAIQEPARVLISILKKIRNSKFEIRNKSENKNSKNQKNFVYGFIKKYYTKNEFELLYNQLEQNFNCAETSSTGRILDAVSLLLGFCKNERKYKHEPIDLLEKNSTKPYTNLKPKIIKTSTKSYELETTLLFEYLINNLHKDKKRLAATAQLYIAEGLHQIIKKHHSEYNFQTPDCHPELDSGSPTIFVSGGITNNKIISDYFTSRNIYLSNTTRPVIEKQFYGIPRGDAGLSFGQIIYFLLQ